MTTRKDFPLEFQPDTEMSTYSIEQVAARVGLTKRTLRYYEEMGLLPPTGRTEGNYRRYTETDVQQLERIKELRDLLGVSLTDIRAMMETDEQRDQIRQAYRLETDAQTKSEQLDRADTLILHQLDLIDKKITGLQQMRTVLRERLEKHKILREQILPKNEVEH